MSGITYYQRKRDVILNRAKDYYENNKERLRELARDKYNILSEEDKNKKREYRKKRILLYVWRKEAKTKRIPKKKRKKKKIENQKSLNIIMNKVVF